MNFSRYGIIVMLPLLVILPVTAKTKPSAQAILTTPRQVQFDYYFDEALRERLAGHWDAAFDLLQACQRLEPDNAEVYFELSKCYLQGNNDTKVISSLEKACQYDPRNVWYKSALAEQCLSDQNIEKAIAAYQSILKIDPENEDAVMMLISIYTQSGKLALAINELSQLEKIQGMSQDITVEKARLYFMMHQNKKGIDEVDKLINTYPHELKYQVLRGDIYLGQGMKKEALAEYQHVLLINPNQGDALYSLSKYYQAVGDTTMMMKVLDQMMKNKNVEVDTKLAVLKNLVTTPAYVSKVQAFLPALLSMYPDEEDLHNYQYMFDMMRNDTLKAESELKTMLDLDPQNKVTWMRMLDLQLQRQKYNKADSLCGVALSYFPNDPDLYFFKSVALFQLGDFRQVISYCHKALPLVPDENLNLRSQVYSQMGDTFYRLGEKDSTFWAYDQALKYQPNNIGTLNNYAYYLSLEKRDLPKAESMSARTIKAEPNNATFLDTYAWVFFVEGNYALAKIYSQQAIENGGDKNADVLEHYGDILYKAGDHEKAVEMWQKSLDAGNTSPIVKKEVETKTYIPK
ncbi:tetratricopeptide repeat protein [Microbacter margulisiae]|uniref:Tetratricopeptide (TPR) repeat protein n=1 Tax=Microbacter margulisiae TaxID=1350067 RepID=A0A7W5H0X3_9PORP|nr:tetratricopeptide repeat protein [Microbacter margulisiae]MBB3186034.1 tetratricopeptide (TPR) repeat protein [Microbacter margulisiae]